MTDPKSPGPDSMGAASSEATQDDEFSLLDLLIVVAKHKLMIAAVTVGAAVLSVIYSLLLPNIYTGTARLLPPQQAQSSAAMIFGQLGGLAGMAGGSLGIKNPNDLYVGILKSRTVADSIIGRFQLQALYRTDTMVATRSALARNTTITAGKDGLIAIDFDDKDPMRAAAVANAYAEELDKLTQSLAVTEAAQRRLFFERQLLRVKTDLAQAEIAARSALAKGGVAMVGEQGKTMIESIARLRAQITAKEIQISAMKGFATEQNSEFVKARQEFAALRQQLAKLEGTEGQIDGLTVAKDAGLGLKNMALMRDVKYYEVLFEAIAKQYELAKIDEAKESGIIQVVDKAIPPDRKSKPKRALIVMIATIAAGFVALLWAFVREARERASEDPVQAGRLSTLRRYASFRRIQTK